MKVTVLDRSGNGAPAVGVPVVFVDPDGTLVANVNSDSNGKAQADVLPGASVTTVVTLTTEYLMRTTLAIKPGDDLELGTRNADTSAAGGFTVSWPAAPGGPAFYYVYGPCGFATFVNGSTLSATFQLENGCKPATMEILVWARDSAGNTVAFNDKAGIAFTPGGSASMNATWSGNLSFQASYTNMAAIFNVTAARHLTDGNGFVASAMQNVGSSFTTTILGPSGTTGRMETMFQGTGGGVQTVRQHIAGNGSTYAMDVGATILPWWGTPTFDAATQTFTLPKVTAGTSNATASLVDLETVWQRSSIFYVWSVYGPDLPSFKLPTIPASIAPGLNPTDSDAQSPDVLGYAADTIANYDAIRATAGTAVTDSLDGVYVGARTQAALVQISDSPGSD